MIKGLRLTNARQSGRVQDAMVTQVVYDCVSVKAVHEVLPGAQVAGDHGRRFLIVWRHREEKKKRGRGGGELMIQSRTK